MIGRQFRSERPARRAGITIIEILVVMTVVAAMLGLCVLLLQMLMKLEADGRARRDEAAALARLAEQFRADLHTARSAVVVDRPDAAGVGLRIQRSGERTIEYQVREGAGVLRVETDRGQRLRRERYDLPRCGPITMALDRDGDRQFARLTLRRRAARNPDDPPRDFEVVALVGKNADRTAEGGKP